MKLLFSSVFIVSFLFSSIAYSKAPDGRIIKIGTGNKKALAYPVISTMCEVFNQKTLNKNISCEAIETGGSEDNLNGIISGKYDAGVIKADMEYNVYNGIGVFAGKSYRDLRNIIGLHNEYLTMIVKNGSKIDGLQALKGKRVYIGNKGSGSRILVDKLIAKNGWKNSDFREIHEEQPDKIYNLLCDNKIDAAIYLVGHPNSIFKKALADCNAKIIGFSRKEIETYVDIFRHVYPSTIKIGIYKNQIIAINTLAAQLLLATSKNLDEKFIYDFVKIISENYAEIKRKNPNLKGASIFDQEVNVIPLHQGVLRFYKTYVD